MDDLDLANDDFAWASDSDDVSSEMEDEPKICAKSDEVPTTPELPVNGRLCAFQHTPVHFGCCSVFDFFRRIIHLPPTTKALVSLRGLFQCTGKITREQMRSKEAMIAAFEAHREEIFTALRDRRTLQTVAHVLLKSNRRETDREKMQFHAFKFFANIKNK
jgi:hypothetical protein